MKDTQNTKTLTTYEQLDRFTKDWINQEIKENKNNKITPQILYNYIYYSEGSNETLSNVLGVSKSLIRRIRN